MNRVLYFNPKVGLLYKPTCGLYRYIIYLIFFSISEVGLKIIFHAVLFQILGDKNK